MTHQPITLSWQPSQTPPLLADAMHILSQRYPIVEAKPGDIDVQFELNASAPHLVIDREGRKATVRFSKTSQALRAVGSLLAAVAKEGQTAEQSGPSQLGVMLDVSRGRVITVEHFKRWLERLALLGFNQAMLYTEDMYRLPDEPCFGYARGAYSPDELRQIDDHAHTLGIEMVPCIQTLGHLEQVLKWWPYADVKDTDSILLVDEERTYELIGKMLDHWSQVFRSRSIHGGMDEAYQLGRGRFQDQHGYQSGMDIFLRHLRRVESMCKARGLSLMIWSDMLFQLNHHSGKQYDVTGTMPEQAVQDFPRGVKMVYWDYYKGDKNGYREVIERHRAIGFEPMVASAVTTAYRFWYDRHEMLRTAVPCIDACQEANVQSLFFTMWGDDGAYCNFDSALAGLAELAEHIFSPRSTQEDIAKRFSVVCGGSLEAYWMAAELHHLPGINTPSILWDDPLLGIYLRSRQLCGPETLSTTAGYFEQLAIQLAQLIDQDRTGDIHHAWQLASVLANKTRLADDLSKAYLGRDSQTLAGIASRIDAIGEQIEALSQSFRNLWMKRNKPFGFEVIQIRLAGLVARYRELAQRLQELDRGLISTIPELEEPSPGRHGYAHYQRLATGSARL